MANLASDGKTELGEGYRELLEGEAMLPTDEYYGGFQDTWCSRSDSWRRKEVVKSYARGRHCVTRRKVYSHKWTKGMYESSASYGGVVAIDLNKPLRTKAGHPVRLLCDNLQGSSRIVVAVLFGAVETVSLYSRSGETIIKNNGAYETARPAEQLALENAPVKHKRTVWVNLYKNGFGMAHSSRDAADGQSIEGRVECREITYEWETPA